MKFYIKNIYFLLVTLVLSNCRSDYPAPKMKNSFSESKTNNSVYIICEGNYTWGNATISHYNSLTKETSNDLFKQKNNKNLGDVCQSMNIFDNKGFLMMNNSSKLEVVNPDNFISIATITGINSPRYFLGINSSKAYVTNIYGDSISVINIQNYSKTKSIYCKGWTEKLVKIDNKAYVTNNKSKYLYILNSDNDLVSDSIFIGSGSKEIIFDKNDMIWLISNVDVSQNIPCKLIKINPLTNKIVHELIISSSQTANNLCLNGTLDSLYYLNNGVYKLGINATSLPLSPIISQSKASIFYGLGIEPYTNNIYVADALDYNQQGLITKYSTNGKELTSFKVGIIPNGFIFR